MKNKFTKKLIVGALLLVALGGVFIIKPLCPDPPTGTLIITK